MRAWDAQLRKLRGAELRAWLEPQKKTVMAVWLKSMNWFAFTYITLASLKANMFSENCDKL